MLESLYLLCRKIYDNDILYYILPIFFFTLFRWKSTRTISKYKLFSKFEIWDLFIDFDPNNLTTLQFLSR